MKYQASGWKVGEAHSFPSQAKGDVCQLAWSALDIQSLTLGGSAQHKPLGHGPLIMGYATRQQPCSSWAIWARTS